MIATGACSNGFVSRAQMRVSELGPLTAPGSRSRGMGGRIKRCAVRFDLRLVSLQGLAVSSYRLLCISSLSPLHAKFRTHTSLISTAIDSTKL